MLLSQINSAYVGSVGVSAIYLGVNKVWPTYVTGTIWYGFNTNSCVTLNITSSKNIAASGIVWGDGAMSGISSGTFQYFHQYGTGC